MDKLDAAIANANWIGHDLLTNSTALSMIKDSVWSQKLYATLCLFSFKHKDSDIVHKLNWKDAVNVVESIRDAAGLPQVVSRSFKVFPAEEHPYWYGVSGERVMYPEVLVVIKEAGWSIA